MVELLSNEWQISFRRSSPRPHQLTLPLFGPLRAPRPSGVQADRPVDCICGLGRYLHRRPALLALEESEPDYGPNKQNSKAKSKPLGVLQRGC